MKEQIRNHVFRDTFKITLQSTKRPYIGNTTELLQTAEAILTEYSRQNIRMTLRQLYYQLVARDTIPNDVVMYKKLSSLLTDARYAGLLDWYALDDLTRSSARASQWSSLEEILKSAMWAYRKPRWNGQPYHVELLTEKEALYSVLSPIADTWHVYLTVNRGFNSATLMYRLVERAQSYINKGKTVIFLYLGDHDPSGLCMVKDVGSRVREILEHRQVQIERFEVKHIALTFEQIEQYNPPENPAKEKDSRFKEYQKLYGDVSWEVDALRPDAMKAIVEQAILRYLDLSKFEAVKAEEDAEKQSLRELVEQFNSV